MATKELSKNYSIAPRDFFDFPSKLDWFDDLAPLGMFFRSPDLKPIKIEEIMKDGKLILRAEMPGVDPDKDIDISLHDGYLTIKGERREETQTKHRSEFAYGSFSRTIALPDGSDQKKIEAQYKDGILEVVIDYPAPVSMGRKIHVSKPK